MDTPLNFDGVNDYVAAPAGVYFNGDLTIEAWVYPKNYAVWSRIIDFGNGPDANNVLLIASGGAGKPIFSIVGMGDIVATQSLALNTWNHVAVTLKGTRATFYINGVASGTGTINTPPANVTRNNCYIGRSNWTSDAYANASMDEVRLWSRALPQCEIQNNMSSELGSGQTGLLAYYKFNQGSINSNNAADTTLTDASGNNRHAKLKGFGLTGTSSNWVAPGGVSTGTTSPAYVTPSVSVNSATACINTSATLTATATGFANTVTYQWESSADNITWSAIAGATTTAYSPATSTAGTRYFRLKATDACGAVYSTGATFIVTNPGLTVTADATQACQGSTVTLTAATVTGAPTYQWQSSAGGNTWTNVSGATAATFAPATSTLGTLSYRVVASYGSGCTLNSTAQTLTVDAAPTASATGGNVTVGQGSSASNLTAVINSAYAAVFQWQSSSDGLTGWANIANSNVLTYTPLTAAAGTLHYRLKVTFAATQSICNATIYSNVRSITVAPAPTVTITPSVVAAGYCAGTNLTLTSTCSDATATPTWTGPNNFTASTANITLSNLTSAQAGKYRVNYLPTTGSIGEQTTTINVRPALAVEKTVSQSSITSGSSSTVVLTGKYNKGSVSKIRFGTSYLATRSADIGSTVVHETTADNSLNQDWLFIPVAGGTANLTVGIGRYYIQSPYSGLYLSANAINPAGIEMGVFNNNPNFEWIITENSQNVIVLQNGNQKALNNTAAQLIAPNSVLGTCSLSISTPTTTVAWNDGPTTTTRTVSPTATTNFIATLTNSAGCSIKDTTTITVVTPTTVAVVPTATSVCQGQTATVTANVMDNVGTSIYVWQQSSDNTNWTPIAGATSSAYNLTTTTATNLYYRVGVTNSLGTFSSVGVQVTVVGLPSVSISAGQTIVCQNTTPTLTVGYTAGFGTPTIQWQSSPDSTVWTNISGATLETYQAPTTTAGKVFYRYIATFTDPCPTFTSQGVAITVKPVLTVGITEVATQTVCQGTYRFFTLSSNDATATYSWQSSTNGTSWTTIANATSASYVAPTNATGVAYYRGIVSAAGCSATSDTRQITTSTVPTVTVASPYTETCINRSVSFTATLSSTSAGTPTFVWQTSNDNLNWATKATGSTYSLSAATVGSTYIRAGVKFAACTDSTFSVSKTLLTTPNPVVTVSLNPTVPCSNTPTVLTANIVGGTSSPKYQWIKMELAGPTFFSGATSSSYTIPAGTASSDNYHVQVQYNANCPTVTSQGVVIKPKTAPSVAIAASGTAFCQGSMVSLTSTITNGVANQTFQWQSSPDGTTWTNIAGATTASYNYTAATAGSTQYRLAVSVGGCNAVVSAATTIAVSSNAVPTLSIAANNSTVCGETEIVVTATPANLNGATPQYEWRRNGELFTGQLSSFVTKSTVDGLGSNTINDIAVVGKNVYLATDNGLAISTDGGATFTNKTTTNGLPSNKVLALGLNGDGQRIIIGTDKGGVISANTGNSFNAIKDYSSSKVRYDKTAAIATIGVSPNGLTAFMTTQNIIWRFLNFDVNINFTTGKATANSIVFKNNTTAYFLTNNGIALATNNVFTQSPITPLPFKRGAFRGDTLFAVNTTNGLNYYINNVQNSVTGLPAASTIQDVLVNDQVVYVTATNGLYMSKDGGKSFSDITSSVGLGSNPGLGRIVRSGSFIYLASSSGLRISSATSPTLRFTANKSDVIECRMTTTGACTNTTSQALTVNYIGDIDPTSINVAVDGTTGTGTWTAVNNAVGYGWELMKYSPDRSSKTFVKNGTVTTNSVILSDLNPSANYELTVKTLCNIPGFGGGGGAAFARLADVTGTGAGGSLIFVSGFTVPRAIKYALIKASSLCSEDELVLGTDFPADYQVDIYSGKDTSFISSASFARPFRVRLTANTKYFYKIIKLNVKTYTFTSSNNDAGSESKRYTVPAGVTKLEFIIGGSKGGGIYGGKGGATVGNLKLAPPAGTIYYLFPGTTTTADAGVSKGKAKSNHGGGGSYVSTTTLRKDAIMVAGGGGGGNTNIPGLAGAGGLVGGNGIGGSIYKGKVTAAFSYGGTATAGGLSYSWPNYYKTKYGEVSGRGESGFMKGSDTKKTDGWWEIVSDFAGGGGYYGGGSYVEMGATTDKPGGGAGGSSYANTAIVENIVYESGKNDGTGYVAINESYQTSSNSSSDFLPLNIVVMPTPTLGQMSFPSVPEATKWGQPFKYTMNLPGSEGFPITYEWKQTIVNYNIITNNILPTQGPIHTGTAIADIFVTEWFRCTANISYCINRVRTVTQEAKILLAQAPPTDGVITGSNRQNRLLIPTLSIAASTTNICAGEQVLFTATASGIADENLYYAWKKNGVTIAGLSSIIQRSDVANGDIITCDLIYPTGNQGQVANVASTNTIIMTVATPAIPKVTIAASTNNVCPGTPITFTPTPTLGGTSPQYSWYLNGDLVQTSPTYASSSFQNNDYVECIMASNALCIAQTQSERSANVGITLKQTVTPTATVFVLDTLICPNSTTSLVVQTENAGSTPQYQWRHNGAPVGNNADYYPTSVSHNDAIWCEVTPSIDGCANTSFFQSNTQLIQTANTGALFTPSATIFVDKDSICAGDSLTFKVQFGSYLGNNPSFAWKKNGITLSDTETRLVLTNIANGDIITGIVTSSLTCVSSTATSNALTAKVLTPATAIVSISTDNTTICPNLPVVISATPTSGGTFPVYNWRLNGNAHNALPHQFFNYTTDYGLGGESTAAVFVRNDTVFAATSGGVSYRVKSDSINSLSYDKGLATSNVQAIYVDDSGVYAGTDGGLSISTDGLLSFRPINTSTSGLSSGNITAITAIGSTLFVGTDNGLNISTNGGASFTSKKTTEGLASNRIRHLFVDGTTLYVGTEGGLNMSTDNGATFTTKTIANALNSDTVLGVWAKGSAIYAATQRGLAFSNNGGTTFTKLTMENGLPNLQVNSVWVVADSMVYAATSGGLGISKNGGKTFHSFYISDTLGSNTVLGVTVAGGRIYAATTGGLSISDPSKIRVYPNNGDVFASNITSNKFCMATPSAISNNLTFTVGSVSTASLAASNIQTTSANLTWTGTTGAYNWRVVPTGTGLDGTVVASGTTSSLPITVTGLVNLTTYDLFVQGACTPEGTVDWVGPLTFKTGQPTVLPIELLEFKGQNTEEGNLLTWTTANEVNNKGFAVERLMANREWSTLGFVNTKGKAATYNFTDKDPLSTSYYRLRQLDNDGKETYSKVISISLKGSNKLKIYPNPVSHILTVETDNVGDFKIINVLGQIVISGKAAQRIDVSVLPQGTYVLKIGEEQMKFVKQ